MEIPVVFSCRQEQLAGMLHVPDRIPAPGLVMCHGFTGHKAEAHRLFVAAARDFAQRGLAVLRFDFRGSGDSEGEFSEMTVSREIEDAEAALDYLASRSEVDANPPAGGLAVLGLSLGGCVAACLAGRDKRVRALVLWAAVAHPERLRDRLAPAFGSGPVLDMEGWPVGRSFLDELPYLQPLEEVSGYVGPSLVVHGSNDEVVPPADAGDYRLALGGRCRRHLIRGADHVFSRLEFKAEAIRVSRDFLLKALGQRG